MKIIDFLIIGPIILVLQSLFFVFQSVAWVAALVIALIAVPVVVALQAFINILDKAKNALKA